MEAKVTSNLFDFGRPLYLGPFWPCPFLTSSNFNLVQSWARSSILTPFILTLFSFYLDQFWPRPVLTLSNFDPVQFLPRLNSTTSNFTLSNLSIVQIWHCSFLTTSNFDPIQFRLRPILTSVVSKNIQQ